MREVVIAGYLRTPFSRVRLSDPQRDWFHSLRADELLAEIIPPLLQQCGVSGAEVDSFYVGSALGVSEQWTFGGRTPVFLANLPSTVAARFLDQQCGSGMAAVHSGFLEIAAGFSEVAIAGGMEHLGRVPMGPALFEKGCLDLNPRLFKEDPYRHWELKAALNMGETAERLAREGGYSRKELDAWGARSHRLAAQAQQEGFLAGEIHPVTARLADGSTPAVDRDQGVRETISEEEMAALKPVFREGGVITAGNSSPLNAGAAALLLMSRRAAETRGIRPLATVRSLGTAGVEPIRMGHGPVPAARKALDHLGIPPENVDCWEINEAFSAVVLHAIEQLRLDPERVNPRGGAIAIGHPLGATGVRLVGTLARSLRERGGHLGCAAACIGGGQGIATVIERAG